MMETRNKEHEVWQRLTVRFTYTRVCPWSKCRENRTDGAKSQHLLRIEIEPKNCTTGFTYKLNKTNKFKLIKSSTTAAFTFRHNSYNKDNNMRGPKCLSLQILAACNHAMVSTTFPSEKQLHSRFLA